MWHIHHTAGNSWTLCCRRLSPDHHHGVVLGHFVSKHAEFLETTIVNSPDASAAVQLFLGSEMAKTLSWKKRCAHPLIVELEPCDKHHEVYPPI
jgi:hypothetical protein